MLEPELPIRLPQVLPMSDNQKTIPSARGTLHWLSLALKGKMILIRMLSELEAAL